MVGKKSGKALLRDEGMVLSLFRFPRPLRYEVLTRLFGLGLERTDNNMELSNWPQIPPINQKNYYT